MIKECVEISVPFGSHEFDLFFDIVNAGIDQYLEAFVKSKFYEKDNRLFLEVHPDEAHILVRRLRENNNDWAFSWADDIENEFNGRD